MMNSKDSQEILEAMTGAESPSDQHLRETISGGEWLYGLNEPDSDDAVRVWAAKESLKGAAERFARAGKTRATDEQMQQIVSEVWEATNPAWTDIDRMERTAVAINRMAATSERLLEGRKR